MFDSIFKDPRTAARHRRAPLAEARERHLQQCAQRGMTLSTLQLVACYLLNVMRYLRVNQRRNELIPLSEVQAAGMRWANRRCWHATIRHKQLARRRFVRVARRWLQFMGCLKLPPPIPHAHADRVAAFLESLREKGFSPATLACHRGVVQTFLDRLCVGKRRLEGVRPEHIDTMVRETISGGHVTRGSIRTYISRWRAFLQYAEQRGWCRAGLAASMLIPPVYAQEDIPTGPSWEDARRLLAGTEGDHPRDIRDRAILMLLIVYGLRANEVCQLRLDDLDWEQEHIRVRRPKVRRTQLFPLSRTVGDAIVRYLKKVRPRSDHRELFLSLNGSRRPLRSARMWSIVASRLQPLKVSLPHYGAHALRHTCATHLLERGHTFKEIGDYLGHSRPSSTSIYAKVDLNGLRRVANVDLGVLL